MPMQQQRSLELPANFETYAEGKQKGFLRMKELKEQGRQVVGVFCSFVPVEIIHAAGLIPVGLCSFSEESIPAGERDLPRNLCPLIKASYGYAVSDTCPYFYFSDLIVGETTCDGKRKMFELMNEIKPTYVMQLPHQRSEVAIEAWRAEIIRLKEKLEDFFDLEITEDAIREAIRNKNRERKAVLSYLELGKNKPSPMSGYELGTRLDAGAFSFDIDTRIQSMETRVAEILEEYEQKKDQLDPDRPRVIITGCPNAGVRDKVIRRVEELGADVVGFDACNGTREKIELVDENEPDVYLALAKKYLDINCSVMSPNDSRIQYLSNMIDEYQADGVIEVILQACHTFNIESHFVRRMVNEKGKAYLGIETDYSTSDSGQISTRLAAFVETMSF